MKTLSILFRRLVTDGRTCDRCHATLDALEAAVDQLAVALRPLGIRPVLKTEAIDAQDFRARPTDSNRIWISGRPLEDWLGATVGANRCCTVCGDEMCRTLDVGGRTYEAIPSALIVSAGLAAASQLVAPAAVDKDGSPACCRNRCDCR